MKLVQKVCIRDRTNEVVDDILCLDKPQTILPKFVPCNTHCKLRYAFCLYFLMNLIVSNCCRIKTRQGKCEVLNGTCGKGYQNYILNCIREDSSDFNKIVEVDSSNCDFKEFHVNTLKKECYIPCKQYKWFVNKSECNPQCVNGSQLISYVCIDASTQRQVLDDFCKNIFKPVNNSVTYTKNCSDRKSHFSVLHYFNRYFYFIYVVTKSFLFN